LKEELEEEKLKESVPSSPVTIQMSPRKKLSIDEVMP
tara:strand:- start:156 stop:266 length:111 start_codon:yes stop_codon:yes gene_type:complete